MDKVSEVIRKTRQAKGWSRKMLAEEVNVSLRSIERWETGYRRPTLFHAVRLALVLEIDLRDFLKLLFQEKGVKRSITHLALLVLSKIVFNYSSFSDFIRSGSFGEEGWWPSFLQNPKLETLQRLAEVLDLRIEELILTAQKDGMMLDRAITLPPEIEKFKKDTGLENVPNYLLTKREWKILYLRHKKVTLQEIGRIIAEDMGREKPLTKERIRQIKNRVEREIAEYLKKVP
jgi:transcriptional regulator with XRE-family HTH domain